jgi:hypothetical protein
MTTKKTTNDSDAAKHIWLSRQLKNTRGLTIDDTWCRGSKENHAELEIIQAWHALPQLMRRTSVHAAILHLVSR